MRWIASFRYSWSGCRSAPRSAFNFALSLRVRPMSIVSAIFSTQIGKWRNNRGASNEASRNFCRGGLVQRDRRFAVDLAGRPSAMLARSFVSRSTGEGSGVPSEPRRVRADRSRAVDCLSIALRRCTSRRNDVRDFVTRARVSLFPDVSRCYYSRVWVWVILPEHRGHCEKRRRNRCNELREMNYCSSTFGWAIIFWLLLHSFINLVIYTERTIWLKFFLSKNFTRFRCENNIVSSQSK